MLPIKSVTARNFKGQTFNHEFTAPITVFTGPNSRGKSSRIEALLLALLGYVPDDKPVTGTRAIYDRYASGATMQVGVSGEVSVGRQWTMDRDKVGYVGPKEEQVAPFVLDPTAYLTRMTGPQRARHLFMEFAAEGINPAEFIAEISSDLKKEIDAGPKAEEFARDIAAGIKPPGKDVLLMDWISALLETASEQKKLADGTVKTLTASVRANSQLEQVASINPNAEEIHRVKTEELGKLSIDIDRLENEQQTIRNEWKLSNESAKELADLKLPDIDQLEKAVEVQVLPPEIKRVQNANKSREQLASKKAGIESELRINQDTIRKFESTSVCPTCGHDVSADNAKNVERYQKEVKRLESELADTVTLLEAAIKNVADAEAEFANDKARHARYVADVNALAEAKNLLSNLKHIQESAAKLPDLESRGKALGIKIGELKSHRDLIAVEVSKAKQQLNELMAHRANEAAKLRVQDELEIALATAAARSAFVKVLKKKLDDAVEKAVSPLVNTMNELCGPILPGLISFKDGELLQASHGHISSSDSEKLLIYASLCIALAARSTIKVALIGRLESFDHQKRFALIKHLLDLYKRNVIRQSILVGVQTGPTPDEYPFGPEVAVSVI